MSTSQQQVPAFAYPIASGYSQPTAENSQLQPGAAAAASSSSQAQPPQQQSRQAAEEARKDRTLAEFLLMLDEYEPLVSLGYFLL